MVHTEEFKSSVKLRWLIDCAIMDRTGAQKWRYDIKNLFNTTTNPYPDQQIEFGLKKLDNEKWKIQTYDTLTTSCFNNEA